MTKFIMGIPENLFWSEHFLPRILNEENNFLYNTKNPKHKDLKEKKYTFGFKRYEHYGPNQWDHPKYFLYANFDFTLGIEMRMYLPEDKRIRFYTSHDDNFGMSLHNLKLLKKLAGYDIREIFMNSLDQIREISGLSDEHAQKLDDMINVAKLQYEVDPDSLGLRDFYK